MELVREPVYQQLNHALAGLIKSGEFPIGTKFLTERQISARLGVSAATANKSLSSLVSEGVLVFRKGVGTYVKGRSLDYNLRALVSFTDEAVTSGKRPGTRVLPLWFERTLYRGDAYEFRNRLDGIQSASVSLGRFL
jgi:DNA-binding GntR family transcriptional regulator